MSFSKLNKRPCPSNPDMRQKSARLSTGDEPKNEKSVQLLTKAIHAKQDAGVLIDATHKMYTYKDISKKGLQLMKKFTITSYDEEDYSTPFITGNDTETDNVDQILIGQQTKITSVEDIGERKAFPMVSIATIIKAKAQRTMIGVRANIVESKNQVEIQTKTGASFTKKGYRIVDKSGSMDLYLSGDVLEETPELDLNVTYDFLAFRTFVNGRNEEGVEIESGWYSSIVKSDDDQQFGILAEKKSINLPKLTAKIDGINTFSRTYRCPKCDSDDIDVSTTNRINCAACHFVGNKKKLRVVEECSVTISSSGGKEYSVKVNKTAMPKIFGEEYETIFERDDPSCYAFDIIENKKFELLLHHKMTEIIDVTGE